jgi:hypothetical protein
MEKQIQTTLPQPKILLKKQHSTKVESNAPQIVALYVFPKQLNIKRLKYPTPLYILV